MVKNVTMVGDRAMFKLPQIEQMPEDFNYISALTKPEIRSLMEADIIQPGLFDKNLCEIEQESVRYILRRNPLRAREMKESRKAKLGSLEKLIDQQNSYLHEHIRSVEAAALKKVQTKAEKLKINNWVAITTQDRVLSIEVDEAAFEEAGRLDGCYCLRTNLSATDASKETVNARYGDLQLVERAFRTMKQSHLELRPIYLRREDHTRGHVFVVMLAYLLQRQLERAWKDLESTVLEGLDLLSTLTTTILKIGDQEIAKIPQPNTICQALLTRIGAKLPQSI
jgi:transposase